MVQEELASLPPMAPPAEPPEEPSVVQPEQRQQPQQQESPCPVHRPGTAADTVDWIMYRTNVGTGHPSGTPYYYNERTRETVWVLPAGTEYRTKN